MTTDEEAEEVLDGVDRDSDEWFDDDGKELRCCTGCHVTGLFLVHSQKIIIFFSSISTKQQQRLGI